jgi:hypothetical protein
MRWYIRPRLRAPVSMAIIGTAAAAAIAVSQGWKTAIPFEVIMLVIAIGYYVWGGKDSDLGAVIGSRADERQASLQTKVTALQGKVMTVAAIVGFLVAIAVRAPVWPFAIFVAIGGISGLAGWVIYREDGHGRPDGQGAEQDGQAARR